MSFDSRAFFERMKDPATTPEQLEEFALQIPPELIRDACTLKAEGMSDVKISRILNKMLAARREAKGEAEPSASDTAGSDLGLPGAVALHEAYLGTTRKFTATLSNGQKHTMELAIPPGVDTGTRVRFRGYGAAGQAGGKPGDLYLVISVSPFPNFARRGNDLFSRLTVPPALLLTGGKVPVRTLDSTAIALTLPAGTKHGQLFRLSGQGTPLLRQPTQRGDRDLR